jgi:hypothetical protein
MKPINETHPSLKEELQDNVEIQALDYDGEIVEFVEV